MGVFERYLSLWVALSIALGVALGSFFPKVFQVFASLEYASVNLPVAVLIWLMIYPMMVQVDFASIRDVGKRPTGITADARSQLVNKALHHGSLGLAVFSRAVRRSC